MTSPHLQSTQVGVYNETILFDNEIYLHNETNLS